MKKSFDFNLIYAYIFIARNGIKITPVHYIIDDLLNSLTNISEFHFKNSVSFNLRINTHYRLTEILQCGITQFVYQKGL